MKNKAHERGDGVPRNVVEAYKWAALAVKGGWAPAEATQTEIAVQMTPAQILEALKLVREFKPEESHRQDERTAILAL